QRVRTLLEPGIEQRAATLCVADLPREAPGLGQSHELCVAARLPQILDVADQRVVAVVDRCAEAERRDLASLRIAIPLRREAEPRRPHREYAPAAGQDFVGRPAVSLRLEMHRQRVDPGAAAAAAL